LGRVLILRVKSGVQRKSSALSAVFNARHLLPIILAKTLRIQSAESHFTTHAENPSSKKASHIICVI
jgi:hypothetical protein